MQVSGQDGIQYGLPPRGSSKSVNTLAEQVFEVLQQYIVTGELRPNQRLVESKIAKRLGISRTPVREALKRLELTGYAKMFPEGGLVVTDFSASQIQGLFEVREALETMAIKLSCQRITEEQINKAEEYYIRSCEAIRDRDLGQYAELHRAFHEELYSACGNEQLWSLVLTLRYQYSDLRLTRVFTHRDWQAQIVQHSRLLKAVRERNAYRAEKALIRHFKTSLKIALQRL